MQEHLPEPIPHIAVPRHFLNEKGWFNIASDVEYATLGYVSQLCKHLVIRQTGPGEV
jgi:hypothetical protein